MRIKWFLIKLMVFFRFKITLTLTEHGQRIFGESARCLSRQFFSEGILIRSWRAQGVPLVMVQYENGERAIFNRDWWE